MRAAGAAPDPALVLEASAELVPRQLASSGCQKGRIKVSGGPLGNKLVGPPSNNFSPCPAELLSPIVSPVMGKELIKN